MKAKFVLGITLTSLSLLLYYVQIALFRDPSNTVLSFLQNMAFVPINVLLVTFILEGFLSRRERQLRDKKMNLIISTFYTELGIELIKSLSGFITNFDQLKSELNREIDWSKIHLARLHKVVNGYNIQVDSYKGNLESLTNELVEHKDFILDVFDNPNLMEDDVFTDMLWAVYHLANELENREDIHILPENDMLHIAGDIERAFKLLVNNWTYYMDYINREYPYLYSLAARKNPFADHEIIFY